MDFEAYIRWLMNGGQAWGAEDPYAPSLPGGSSIPGMIPGYDMTDLGDTAKALNITQDYADIGSDPAMLGGFYGEMPTASMYETEFEANPGYTMLTNAAMMEGTLEQLIADEILNGGSAASAISKINQLIEAGDTSIGVPTYMNNDTGQMEPDLNYVKDVASQFQNAYLTDPTPGQPGVETTTPMSGSSAEWYAKTGTPLPNERYVGDDLASQEQLDFLASQPEVSAELDRQLKAMRQLVGLDGNPYVGGVDGGTTTPNVPQTTTMEEFLGPDSPWQGSPAPEYEEAPVVEAAASAAQGQLPQGAASATPERMGRYQRALGQTAPTGGGDQGPVFNGAFSGDAMSRFANRAPMEVGDPRVGLTPRQIRANPMQQAATPQGIMAPGSRGLIPSTGEPPRSPALSVQPSARQQAVSRYNERAAQGPSQAWQNMRDTGTAWAEQRVRADEAEKARREREQIAYILGQQGHTPYNDTMNTRRMMAQQMGFGR